MNLEQEQEEQEMCQSCHQQPADQHCPQCDDALCADCVADHDCNPGKQGIIT